MGSSWRDDTFSLRGEGLLGDAEVRRVRSLLRRARLPLAGPAVAPDQLVELMTQLE